ncbi:MAG: hypothetical protein DKT66_02875 [Candidatus Melainabacteria bacterium]|nr:MAG: hypothetical protein DKT66_02875 [Candidatus Melainabacteria bacterium]
MKLTSLFLAAVMVSAMAVQTAEARDHHGWRNQHRNWNNNYNRKIWKQQRAWNNKMYKQSWNNRGGYRPGRPWDNAYDNAMRAEAIQRQQQAMQYGWYWR